jgi:hypothetical protein
MRHLKIYEDYNYSNILQDKIKNSDWNTDKVTYHISPVGNKNPEKTKPYYSLNEALSELESTLNTSDVYCIFESRVKLITQDDIDSIYNSKKYNL